MTTPAGRIHKLHGSDGSVTLTLYDTFPADFTTDIPLMVAIDGLDVPLWCSRFERRGRSGAVAAFDDFDTDRRAEELLGLEFRLTDTTKEADDVFCLEDLLGFRVVAHEAGSTPGGAPERHAGTLTDFYDSDINPLFEIDFGHGPVLVPAAEEFIAGIDFAKRTLKLVLPEGLLDLR